MNELTRWRWPLLIGRRNTQHRGELANSDQLPRLARFAAVDAHDADTRWAG